MKLTRCMRVAAVLALLTSPAAAQCKFPQAAVSSRLGLVYRFAPRTMADTVVLGVTLAFTGSTAGVDTIVIPWSWAGQPLRGVRRLHSLDSGVVIDSTPLPGRQIVRHGPGRRVHLAYDVMKGWDGPFEHPDEFQPVVFDGYIEVAGANALVHPRIASAAPVVVGFDWTALPATWAVATSFGAARRCEVFRGPWRDVVDGVYAAGDFRLRRFTIAGKPAVLAIRGGWTFTDSAVVAEVQRDVGAVRAFWHDNDFPYYLVTWSPFDADHGTSDGTAFTNGMWIFMSKLDSLPTQLTQLTHEAFHTWDPRRMGRESDADARQTGWFREGFTTYYADMIAYRAGFLPLNAVVGRTNRSLAAAARSGDAYARGDAIALWLDGAIRADSHGKHSLDDVMRDMVRGAAKPLTLARVLSTADRYLSPGDRRTWHELANGTRGVPSTISAGALSPCVRVAMDSVYAFDLGFDARESIAARRVTGVRADGAAYAAGLRNGQTLIGWSIDNGQTDRQATFAVRIDSVRRRIAYYPRGAGTLVPQLHVAGDDNHEPASCSTPSR